MNLPLRCLKPIKPRASLGGFHTDRCQAICVFGPGLPVKLQFVQVCCHGFVPEQTDLSVPLETMNLAEANFRSFRSAGFFHAGHKISWLEAAGLLLLCRHAAIFQAFLCKLSGQVDSQLLSLVGSTPVISVLCLSGRMSEGRGQRGLKSIRTIAARKKKERKKTFVRLPIDSQPLQGAEISKRKLTNKSDRLPSVIEWPTT